MNFPVADIYMNDGTLYIDTTGVSVRGKHYNVQVTKNPDSSVTVRAEKPEWDSHFLGTAPEVKDPSIYANPEKDTHWKRNWPWAKPRLVLKAGFAELKERKKRTYHAKTYIITE